jgi:hypothetical protein
MVERELGGKYIRSCSKPILEEFALKNSAPRIGWETFACKKL